MGRAQTAEIALSKREAEDPATRSGEESLDQEPDCHPSRDCERSEDDKESSQFATRLSLDLGRGLLFTRPGKSTGGSGLPFDKSLSEDQERLHILIVKGEQDASAHSFGGLPRRPGCKRNCNRRLYVGGERSWKTEGTSRLTGTKMSLVALYLKSIEGLPYVLPGERSARPADGRPSAKTS